MEQRKKGLKSDTHEGHEDKTASCLHDYKKYSSTSAWDLSCFKE